MMVMWDNYAVYKHAEEKGIIKGEAKGRAEGRAEGKKEKAKEIALKLLALNTPIDIIFQSTGLSIEEIKKLKS